MLKNDEHFKRAANSQQDCRTGCGERERSGAAEPPPVSAGSHGDSLSVLRQLAEGVRGMGMGDPDCGDRIEASDVVRWAADEIGRLRFAIRRIADQDATLSVCEGNVTVTMDAALTDEEREAVHRLCRAVTHYSAGGVAVDGGSFAGDDERAVAVVRGWLARLT
jgi:hypothetical protein